MAYSNQTTHYGLPLPIGSDKSTWLDTNQAFEAIDSAVYSAAQTASSQAESISTLQSQMVTANANISTNATAISAEASTREAQDTAHSTAISNINSKLGTTSIQGHGDGTVTGILMDIVEGYDQFVTGHTPETLVIGGTPTTGITVSSLDITVDDYFFDIAAHLTLAVGGITYQQIAGTNYYGAILGEISAAQMAAHVPNLETGVSYTLARMPFRKHDLGIYTASGQVNMTSIDTELGIALIKDSTGKGIIALNPSTSQQTMYVKVRSSTNYAYADDKTGAGIVVVGRETIMKRVSEIIPDIE